MRALIVILWRAGLRIHEALESPKAISMWLAVLCSCGAARAVGRREAGMDAWAWEHCSRGWNYAVSCPSAPCCASSPVRPAGATGLQPPHGHRACTTRTDGAREPLTASVVATRRSGRGRLYGVRNVADLPTIRRDLEAHRDEMRGRIATLAERPELGAAQGFGKRIGDGTVEAISRLTEIGVGTSLEVGLERTERALAKLDEGTYGQCDACGKPIAPKRLQAMPNVVLCIECAAAQPRAVAPRRR